MRAIRRRLATTGLKDDTRGSVFVEAALVMPLIVMILAAITEWGLTLYQYHVLSTANASGLRQLIISRGFANPRSAVINEFTTWSSTLGVKPEQVKVEVQDLSSKFVECKSDAECTTALDTAAGRSGRVSVNYPCTMQFTPQVASPCPIVIVTTGLIE